MVFRDVKERSNKIRLAYLYKNKSLLSLKLQLLTTTVVINR